ncbi:MAG TPA: hypothetical protein VNI60_09845 [Pyrinomonadaceae bacterium]|nr:hypothetical protein [Pyrinomonadaceae bacterium]
MNSGNVIGQMLDNKYKIEKELGKGGMGRFISPRTLARSAPSPSRLLRPSLCSASNLSSVFAAKRVPPEDCAIRTS